MRQSIARFWDQFKQGVLFKLGQEIGPLTQPLERLIRIWEVLRVEEHVPRPPAGAWPGRPPSDRSAIARAFVAKTVLGLPTTSALVDRLEADATLRRLCGFERRKDIPSESTFSRAFAEFAESQLTQMMHAQLVEETYGGEIVGHISRDSTAIEARERPLKKVVPPAPAQAPARRRGRPKKGEEPPPPVPARLERQSQEGVTLAEMLSDLPKECDVGTKKNSQGYKVTWQGYKLHLDISDIGMPISAIVTSASMHDSQAAIPLMKMTEERGAIVLYELMDSAYDTSLIEAASRKLGRVPIIDINPRRDLDKAEAKRQRSIMAGLGVPLAEDVRFNERTTAERANARMKDEFGARTVRVRGHVKVSAHLMFGVCVLAADTLLRLLV